MKVKDRELTVGLSSEGVLQRYRQIITLTPGGDKLNELYSSPEKLQEALQTVCEHHKLDLADKASLQTGTRSCLR